MIEASWIALVDAIRLELMRLAEQGTSIERAVEDYCWGVQGRHPGRHCRV